MAKQSNPGALEGEQLISLAEPFGGWVSPLSGTSGGSHFLGSIEGVEAPTFAKQTSNQYAESAGLSLFHYEKFGHMAPGYGYSVVTDNGTKINDLPINGGVESANQLGIVALRNGRLLQLAVGGGNTNGTTYDPMGHTPISSSHGDMILFRDYQTTPVEWVIWSYDYSGGSDIAIVHASNILTGANDVFWTSTLGGTALQNVPHKIFKGPDGNIYITDGPYLRQIVVPVNTALSALTSANLGNVLQVGSGWTIIGGCEYKNYTATIASDKVSNYSYGHTRVFLWDGTTTTSAGVTSTAAQYIYDIPDNCANGIFFDGQTLYAFTSGRNLSSKIWELTSKGFVKVFETPFLPATSLTTTTFLQGAIDNFQDGISIGAMKGDGLGHLLRYYGSGFHDEGYLTDGDTATGNIATSVGMVRNLFSNVLFVGVSYTISATPYYKIYYSNHGTYQTGTGSINNVEFRSILYTSGILGRRQYPMGFKMSLSRIKLFLSQWGTGASLYLSLFEGYDTCRPGNTTPTYGGVDRLNVLIDTNSSIPNGFISGTNPGSYPVGYLHYYYPVGTNEIDLSDISIVNLSSFYMNIRWTHASQSNVAAIIRRCEIHVAQSQ